MPEHKKLVLHLWNKIFSQQSLHFENTTDCKFETIITRTIFCLIITIDV